MTDVPDARLLEQFARNGSEDAFAALVQRHIALVHSVAMRHTANVQHAQDITQAVFVILARKAGSLGRRTVLPGWLYHTARLTAANLQRAETSRVRREQEAFMQSQLEESVNDALWRELSPQLDEAMAGLGASERDALVLRYFQNKSMAEVGQFLGLEENTAQKRVSRALEKLRAFFVKRGVSSTTAILTGAISAHSVQAVPVTLAKSVTAVALAKGATASTSTLTLIKGALKIMAWTKAKTAIVVGAVAILAATSTTVIGIKLTRAHRAPPDTTALSPVELNVIADIQPDGTILFQGTAEETNSTSRTASADSINDAQAISRVTDEFSKPMKFTKRPRGGFFILLNKPVPPGGKVSYTVEGTEAAGLIQSKGMGEYGVEFTGNLGNVADAHLVQVWRLPMGATLLEKNRGMEETTNADRIELRIDEIIPQNGSYPIGFRYRLPDNAK
jgi:RNA polymerase sigma factor (sigma-70 family)